MQKASKRYYGIIRMSNRKVKALNSCSPCICGGLSNEEQFHNAVKVPASGNYQ